MKTRLRNGISRRAISFNLKDIRLIRMFLDGAASDQAPSHLHTQACATVVETKIIWFTHKHAHTHTHTHTCTHIVYSFSSALLSKYDFSRLQTLYDGVITKLHHAALMVRSDMNPYV